MKRISWALLLLALACGCGKNAKELYREAIDDLNREAELLGRFEKERDDLKKKQFDILKKVDDGIADMEKMIDVARRAADNAKDDDWHKSLDKHEADLKKDLEGRAKMIAAHATALGAAQKKVDDQAAVVREASKRRDDAKAAAE